MNMNEQVKELMGNLDTEEGREQARRLYLEALYMLAPHDLGSFGELVFGHAPAPHHQIWIDELMGDGNIAIVAPPGHGKTVWLTAFVAWYLGRDPSKHVAYVSNTATQAHKPSVAIRDLIEMDGTIRKVFPKCQPWFKKGWAEDEWFLQRPNVADKDASFFAIGVNGPFLGARCDLLILDDVCDMENMATKHQRDKLKNWVDTVADSRMTPGGRIVSIMTRWHEDDLMELLKRYGNFKVIHMEALGFWEKQRGIEIDSDEDGSALWPNFWTKEKLLAKRKASPKKFELMYQGRDSVDDGQIFNDSWWGYYKHPDANPDLVVQSIDTAYKEKEENDWTVIETWQICRDRVQLLDVFRERVQFPDLLKTIHRSYDEWRPHAMLIEDKASGTSLIQTLQATTLMPIFPVVPRGDKIARANASTGIIEVGKVELPVEAAWLGEFKKEHRVFPNGTFDDQVDATTQFLVWVQTRPALMETIDVFDSVEYFDRMLPHEDPFSQAFKYMALPF